MIVAPANTPKPVVGKLHAALKAVTALPEVQAQMINLGTIPVDSPSPEAQQQFINSEIVRWKKVVEFAGMAGTQ